MRVFVSCALVLWALSGCAPATYLPDGGRARINCSSSPKQVPVKIIRLGQPSPGLEVRAINQGDLRLQAATTNADGIALITDAVGPGLVRVQASINDLVAGPGDLNFLCGECDCSVTPPSLTLTLQ